MSLYLRTGAYISAARKVRWSERNTRSFTLKASPVRICTPTGSGPLSRLATGSAAFNPATLSALRMASAYRPPSRSPAIYSIPTFNQINSCGRALRIASACGIDRLRHSNRCSIAIRAVASSSARFTILAACFRNTAASRSFLPARSFALPAFWSASPARSSASLARSIAEPAALNVCPNCLSASAVSSAVRSVAIRCADNSIARPTINTATDNLASDRYLRACSSVHSAKVSPITPTITNTVATSPDQSQKYRRVQKLLDNQAQIINSDARYRNILTGSDERRFSITFVALIALVVIRLIRDNKKSRTMLLSPSVLPLPTRQLGHLHPITDPSHQRPSQASCGGCDEP